jgi:hypothetical protein
VEEVKTELTFRLPAVLHKHTVSDQLLREFQAFIGEVTKQKYIFLSKVESIVIEEGELFKEQLPPDVYSFYFRIEGRNSFVEVKSRAKFKHFGEVNDESLNQVIIQGPDPVAVRGLHSKVAMLLRPQRFPLRSIFYSFPILFFWSTLILLWFGEYRIAKLAYPGMSLNSPLSAVGAITIGAVGLGSVFAYGNLLMPFFRYWFPYFEIEGNLSQHRLSFQKLVGGVGTAIVTAGVLNLVTLIGK